MTNKIPDAVYEQIIEYSIISAVDAVIYNNGKILLAKRIQEPCKGQWWIPGGRQQKFESVEEAIRRKIKEEVGLNIKVEKMIDVQDVIFDKTAFPKVKTGVHYLARIYLARLIDKNQEVQLDSSQENYIWADKKWFEQNKNQLHKYVIDTINKSKVFN